MLLLTLLACPIAESDAPRPTTIPTEQVEEPPAPPARTGPLADVSQLLVVRTASWDAVDGTLARFERDATSDWTAVGPEVDIVVGLKGLGWGIGLVESPTGAPVKREGDKKAPAGFFKLLSTFGYAAEAPTGGLLYVRSIGSSRCVDDSSSQFYNRVVDSTAVTKDWKSAEKMVRNDELYRWGILVDHNPDQQAQAGSCIFVHVGRTGKGTVGCTALDEDALLEVIGWLRSEANPVLVQLPEEVYAAHRSDWHLP